jgi:hypothetical protein
MDVGGYKEDGRVWKWLGILIREKRTIKRWRWRRWRKWRRWRRWKRIRERNSDHVLCFILPDSAGGRGYVPPYIVYKTLYLLFLLPVCF